MKKFIILISIFWAIHSYAQDLHREFINPTPGYSNVVSVAHGELKTIYIAGQVGSGTRLEDHLRSSFLKVLEQLTDAGASFSDVVKMTIYIVDYNSRQLDMIAKVRKEVFGEGPMPAITMVGVEKLAFEDMKVETEAVAMVKLENGLLSSAELRNQKVYKSIDQVKGVEDSVYILDLSGTVLQEVPSEAFGLKNLQALHLNNTGIQRISEGIGDLDKLQKLNLSHLTEPNHHLTGLPMMITRLQHLEEINLNGNPNINMPATFDKLSVLPKLKILAIMNNGINQLPDNLDKMKSLEQVWLGQNKGLIVPDALKELNQLTMLKHLGFGGVGIASINFEIGTFQNLENLWLAGNQIRELQGIEGLSRLKSITLNNNGLKELPSQIYSCEQLEFLALDSNPDLDFKGLFDRITDLPKLRVLSLSHNNLESLPGEIGEMESLEYLIVKGNALKESDIRKFREKNTSIKVIYE